MKLLSFSERLFFMIVWVLIAIILANFLLHLMNTYNVLPGVAQWIGAHTNLQAEAGG